MATPTRAEHIVILATRVDKTHEAQNGDNYAKAEQVNEQNQGSAQPRPTNIGCQMLEVVVDNT